MVGRIDFSGRSDADVYDKLALKCRAVALRATGSDTRAKYIDEAAHRERKAEESRGETKCLASTRTMNGRRQPHGIRPNPHRSVRMSICASA